MGECRAPCPILWRLFVVGELVSPLTSLEWAWGLWARVEFGLILFLRLSHFVGCKALVFSG